jgi:hypothetical protein
VSAVPLDPPPPFYNYELHLSSSQLCSSSNGSKCQAPPGFDFNRIASINSYKTSWTVDGTTETVSYAPCSSGIANSCGTNPWNQCAGKTGCCAVCNSLSGATGPDANCLGLSSKLLGVKVQNPVTVIISYGGG